MQFHRIGGVHPQAGMAVELIKLASDDFAAGRLRKWVLFRVSVLTAVAISFTGIIAFVGLVGPHIARLAVGEDHRFFLPASALAGAFILSGASLVAKTLVPGILIPDGIVTALIGIPLFLGLLVTQRRRG